MLDLGCCHQIDVIDVRLKGVGVDIGLMLLMSGYGVWMFQPG